MTVAAGSIVNSYIGTSAANSYSFSFPAFQQSDITVVITSPAGLATTCILGTDFTVSGLNLYGAPATSGSITLVSNGQLWLTGGNLTTNWIIAITRIMQLQQNSSIRNQGDFYQEYIENALDSLSMQIQQLGQAIVAPVIPAGPSFSTDITTTSPGTGLIVTDAVTGKTYRILVSNGELSTQEIT